jgi:hypothetical protein
MAATFFGTELRTTSDDHTAQCFSRRRQLNYEWLE